MKKSIAALALAGSIALTGAVPAMAATYPAPGAGSGGTGAVSDGTVTPGQVFTFSGTGFVPGETITITITITSTPQALGGGFSGGAAMSVPSKITVLAAPQTLTTTAGADGSFAFPLSLNEPGTYTLTAAGANHSVTTSVTVAGAATGAGTGLSNTGGSGAGLANTGGNGLANTGADSSLVLWSLVGAGALAAGAASVVVVRRRANAEPSA
ncbi:LPXTG cell wall anchor domain-containing protein [Arthrobacter sp. NPDC056493]|uniref:LPXTG cell wall anchor domain-containing protein n=1 Tax=Arthrobacter sp. NPDC056493 TaxID=3345839 RepID=UPI00367226D1